MCTKVFHSSNGFEVHVFPIMITLGERADISCMILGSGINKQSYTLEGKEYLNWNSDDEYIKQYICSKEPYLGQPIMSGGGIPIIQPIINDTLSVHNDGDILKITALQEQIDTQAIKLKTIMDLLIKNGNI